MWPPSLTAASHPPPARLCVPAPPTRVCRVCRRFRTPSARWRVPPPHPASWRSPQGCAVRDLRPSMKALPPPPDRPGSGRASGKGLGGRSRLSRVRSPDRCPGRRMPGPRPRKGPQARGQGVAAAKQVRQSLHPGARGRPSRAWAGRAVGRGHHSADLEPGLLGWHSPSGPCRASAAHVWAMRPELSPGTLLPWPPPDGGSGGFGGHQFMGS